MNHRDDNSMKEFEYAFHFTPKEANRRLPLVRRITEDILERGRRLKRLLARSANQDDLPQEAFRLKQEIEDLVRELEELGCFYKDWDFEMGLVDFPAVIDNEEVFLCWRSDEPAVEWYHGLHEGYTGRRPIPASMLWPPEGSKDSGETPTSDHSSQSM